MENKRLPMLMEGDVAIQCPKLAGAALQVVTLAGVDGFSRVAFTMFTDSVEHGDPFLQVRDGVSQVYCSKNVEGVCSVDSTFCTFKDGLTQEQLSTLSSVVFECFKGLGKFDVKSTASHFNMSEAMVRECVKLAIYGAYLEGENPFEKWITKHAAQHLRLPRKRLGALAREFDVTQAGYAFDIFRENGLKLNEEALSKTDGGFYVFMQLTILIGTRIQQALDIEGEIISSAAARLKISTEEMSTLMREYNTGVELLDANENLKES